MTRKIIDFGIGTDIEKIGRFRSFVVDDAFLKKVFTENELDYCFSHEEAAPHLAARFVGKEAVIKALGNMGGPDTEYKKIEITKDDAGAPIVRLNDENLNHLKAKISLSHCDDRAIAFAIVYQYKKL